MALVQVDFNQVVGFVELLLRIVQLFCEGHFIEMKRYFREQADNVKQVNLVHSGWRWNEGGVEDGMKGVRDGIWGQGQDLGLGTAFGS